jgi:hypothetical protein
MENKTNIQTIITAELQSEIIECKLCGKSFTWYTEKPRGTGHKNQNSQVIQDFVSVFTFRFALSRDKACLTAATLQ